MMSVVVMMVMFRLLHTIIIIQGSIIFVWHKKFLPFLTNAVIKKNPLVQQVTLLETYTNNGK